MKATPLMALLLILAVPQVPAQALFASQAMDHIGENAVVCGKVRAVRSAERSKGRPTFITLGGVYPERPFTVLIWGRDLPKFAVAGSYATHNVCAHGVIRLFRGNPEMVVRDPVSLEVR